MAQKVGSALVGIFDGNGVALLSDGAAIGGKVIGSAFDDVAMTDAATITFDWTAGAFRTLTATGIVGASRALGNPTGFGAGQGRFRNIYVVGGDGTARTLTFGTNFKNPPSITDLTAAKGHLLTVFAVSATHFVVTAVRAL